MQSRPTTIPRFYYPKHLTAAEIVVRAGFTPATTGMGWERDVRYHPHGETSRLHATTHDGRIDLHWDEPGALQYTHKTVRQHPRIAFCMREFESIDRQAATVRTHLALLIRQMSGKTADKW